MPAPNKFRLPRFYPILDTTLVDDLEQAAKRLLDGGVRILQYRHKNAWIQSNYDEAARIGELCRQAACVFILNDRADYAQLLGAGLHVGQDDLPPVACRKIMDPATVIGFSTHNRRQLLLAKDQPVDYLALGPIFPTTSKLNPDPVVGLDNLKLLRSLSAKPLVAIGGVSLDNAASVLEAGADSVAVLSGLGSPVAEWLALTN